MRQKTSFRDRIIYYWSTQGTEHRVLQEESRFRFSNQTQPWFYIVNPTGTHVHLLNEWQTGTRSKRSFILPAEWKAMSLDPHRKDLSTRPILTSMKSKSREPLVSRAFAGSMWCTRSSSGLSWRTPSPCLLLVVDHEACTCRSPGWEPPKRDLGTMASNSFQVKESDRKTIIRMKSELKFSHFTEVPKATQEEMKGNLQFLPQAGEDLRWKSQASIHSCRPHHQDTCVVGSQSVLRVEKTPGNEM